MATGYSLQGCTVTTTGGSTITNWRPNTNVTIKNSGTAEPVLVGFQIYESQYPLNAGETVTVNVGDAGKVFVTVPSESGSPSVSVVGLRTKSIAEDV